MIEFVAELPKTVTGKIQRYKLRERPVSPNPVAQRKETAPA